MKEKRIKFIASDLDGTLLLNGAQKVSQELIPLIKRLNDNGIIFVQLVEGNIRILRGFLAVWRMI